MAELDKDLSEDGRQSTCNITLLEFSRSLIENRVKNYVEIISSNLDDRFPSKTLTILEAFSIFDVSQIPSETTQEFKQLYGQIEINEITNHLFSESLEGCERLSKE